MYADDIVLPAGHTQPGNNARFDGAVFRAVEIHFQLRQW